MRWIVSGSVGLALALSVVACTTDDNETAPVTSPPATEQPSSRVPEVQPNPDEPIDVTIDEWQRQQEEEAERRRLEDLERRVKDLEEDQQPQPGEDPWWKE